VEGAVQERVMESSDWERVVKEAASPGVEQAWKPM